jgi:hypothetical protein
MATATKKRKDLTLEEKLAVIDDYERERSSRKVGEKHGISYRSVVRYYENREEIRKLHEENKNLTDCRVSRGRICKTL